MLMKNENSLYRVRGRKLQGVYFALDTGLAGKREAWACPTAMVRCVVGSWSSSASDSSAPWSSCAPGLVGLAADRKLGRRMVDWNRERALGARWCRLRRALLEGSRGASS